MSCRSPARNRPSAGMRYPFCSSFWSLQYDRRAAASFEFPPGPPPPPLLASTTATTTAAITTGTTTTARRPRGDSRLHPVGCRCGVRRPVLASPAAMASGGTVLLNPHRLHVHVAIPAAEWNLEWHWAHWTNSQSVPQPAHVYPRTSGSNRCSVLQRGQRTMFIRGSIIRWPFGLHPEALGSLPAAPVWWDATRGRRGERPPRSDR